MSTDGLLTFALQTSLHEKEVFFANFNKKISGIAENSSRLNQIVFRCFVVIKGGVTQRRDFKLYKIGLRKSKMTENA